MARYVKNKTKSHRTDAAGCTGPVAIRRFHEGHSCSVRCDGHIAALSKRAEGQGSLGNGGLWGENYNRVTVKGGKRSTPGRSSEKASARNVATSGGVLKYIEVRDGKRKSVELAGRVHLEIRNRKRR